MRSARIRMEDPTISAEIIIEIPVRRLEESIFSAR